jgi:hypothetical protein
VWTPAGDLSCSTRSCTSLLLAHGLDKGKLAAKASAKGWHLFEGMTFGGNPLESHLCPACIGTNRSKLPPAPPRLEEDQTLF